MQIGKIIWHHVVDENGRRLVAFLRRRPQGEIAAEQARIRQQRLLAALRRRKIRLKVRTKE